MHRKAALGLTLLQILSKAIKPINAGIHVRNVGTQYYGIAGVQLCKNIHLHQSEGLHNLRDTFAL